MLLNDRQIEIIQTLLHWSSAVSVTQLAKSCGVSRQTIYEDLYMVEQWLKLQQLGFVQRTRKGVSIIKHHNQPERAILFALFGYTNTLQITNAQHRQILILVYLLKEETFTWEELSQRLLVSRATLLNDLQELRQALAAAQIELVYTKNVYSFIGDEIKVRALCVQLLTPYSGQLQAMGLIDSSYIQEISAFLKQSSALALDVAILALYIQQIRVERGYYIAFKQQEGEDINLSALPAAVLDRYQHVDERLYLALVIGSFFRFKDQQLFVCKFEYLQLISKKLTLSFRSILNQNYPSASSDILLSEHLKSVYCRSLIGMVLCNPLYDEIIERYAQPFALAKLILESFFDNEQLVEQEASYVTILLLSFQQEPVANDQTIKLLVLCYEGVAVAQLIKQQLQQLGLNQAIITCGSLSDIFAFEQFDLVLTTTAIRTVDIDRQLVVTPILSLGDLSRIVLKLELEEMIFGDFNTLNQHIKESLDKRTYQQLIDTFLGKQSFKYGLITTSDTYSLLELLPVEHIQVVGTIESWQAAIWCVAQPLLERGIIEKSYVEEMINNVYQYGPYMVLKAGFALPHASVEAAMGCVAMSLLVLQDAVSFSDAPDHQVQVLLMVVPNSEHSHIRAMAQFIDKIDNDEWFTILKQQKNSAAVIALLHDEQSEERENGRES